MSSVHRLLFLRPDAYGDIFLFEPIPRLIRQAWPDTEVAVLIRESHRDIIPLLEADGVRWLTTACDPYRQGPGDSPAAFDALRETVRAFAPDCVVAACSEQTWLEAAVAAFLPETRQVSLGQGLTDPLIRAVLAAVVPVDWSAIYPQKIPVAPELHEWEKNLALAGALLGEEPPRWWPVARVPEEAKTRAAQILAEAGLAPGQFVACAAAGSANVRIKNWPAEHYGETLAWLEREHGLRALLIGHVAERGHLETVREAARRGGADPALWLGENGEMPVVAGLLDTARFYFGNDTGALHLAAALGRPVVGIYGGGTWPRFQPVARRALTVVQPLPCFGCGWDCYFADAPCVRTISPESVRQALEQFLRDESEGAKVFEATGLDPGARALIDTATPRVRFLHADRAERARQVDELTARSVGLADQLQTDDREHRRQLDELTALLRASETDRDARLRQVETLGERLQREDAEHGRQVRELAALLQTSEADRDARLQQIAALGGQIEAEDREHRRQVDELTALLRTSETDRDARLRQVETLTPLLLESEADRAARGLALTTLNGHIATLEDQLQSLRQPVGAITPGLTPLLDSGTGWRDRPETELDQPEEIQTNEHGPDESPSAETAAERVFDDTHHRRYHE